MATYYVATTGSDSNPGTSGSPFLTVTKGASVLAPGDTCYVRAGTYAQSLFDAIPAGNVNQSVTISKDPDAALGSVILQPPGSAARVLSFGTPVSYITVSGLVLDGVNVSSDCVKITSGAHHITLSDCELKNSPNDQGLLINNSDANLIQRCSIHDNGSTDLDHQIYIQSPNNIVEECHIYGGFGYAIHQYDGNPEDNIYRRNRIHNTFGILVSSGLRTQVYYNLCYSNLGDISVQYSEDGALIYNNTCYQGTRGIYTDPSVLNTTVRNNISYLHTDFSGNYINQGTGTIEDHNLFGVNPLFVASGSQNFRIQPGSPAINAGVDVGLTQDIVGKLFIGVPDIGAYEFGLAAPTNLRRVI